MPGTNSTLPLPDDPRARRNALRKIKPSDVQCAVPGCPHGRVTHDCCYSHSLAGLDNSNTVPNDGIIDWIAVDVAARGLRKVRLTWVEKDIAVGTIFARGGGPEEAENFTGARVTSASTQRRFLAAQRIAEALNRTSNEERELRLTPREVEQLERALEDPDA